MLKGEVRDTNRQFWVFPVFGAARRDGCIRLSVGLGETFSNCMHTAHHSDHYVRVIRKYSMYCIDIYSGPYDSSAA